jgi:hypothetical protein
VSSRFKSSRNIESTPGLGKSHELIQSGDFRATAAWEKPLLSSANRLTGGAAGTGAAVVVLVLVCVALLAFYYRRRDSQHESAASEVEVTDGPTSWTGSFQGEEPLLPVTEVSALTMMDDGEGVVWDAE